MNGRQAFDLSQSVATNEHENGRPLSGADILRQLTWAARNRVSSSQRLDPVIVLIMGRECYAAARRSKRRTPQIRVWSKASGRWRAWRTPLGSELVRYATKADEAAFMPDYGAPWEEGL